MDNNLQKNETLAINSVELIPVLEEDDLDLGKYKKISFGELVTLGAGFSALDALSQTVTGTGGVETCEVLYRIANSDKTTGTLQMLKGQPNATYGTFVQNGEFSSRAIFEQASGADAAAAAQNVPVDPTMLFMAAALYNVNQKLDAIQATQQEMMDYMKQRDESELRGDLKFLTDVFNNYKNAWNNDLYIKNNHAQALTCKRRAEQKIDFYRQEIIAKIKETKLLHGDRSVEKKLEDVETYFKDYQMAMTMFALASFMDVMLSKNFEKGYLESITGKIRDYSFQYRELYTDCYNLLLKDANHSVDAILRKGLAKASKATGEGVAKAPLLNKTPLDNNLLQVSVQLETLDAEKRTEPLKALAEQSSASVLPYVENLEYMNRMHNEPQVVMCDREYVYMPA